MGGSERLANHRFWKTVWPVIPHGYVILLPLNTPWQQVGEVFCGFKFGPVSMTKFWPLIQASFTLTEGHEVSIFFYPLASF